MGLFSRKGSKPSINDNSSLDSGDGPPRIRTSGLKSPKMGRGSNGAKSPESQMTFDSFDMGLPRAPDPALDPAAYLRSIQAVRERSRWVLSKAKRNQLNHFNVDMSMFSQTAAYVVSIIKRDYGDDYASIPRHGRWQHFDVGGRPRIDQLLATWPSTVDSQERTRRLIDLFLVSVLIDAGAGARWQYKSKQSGKFYRRSEGLAVASLEMFTAGMFSSDSSEPCQVDGRALKRITPEILAKGLQISPHNVIAGLEGRAGLLLRLGYALDNNLFFGPDARPGNMLDYLLSHSTTQMSSVPIIALPTLWTVLMDGLAPIWPASRTKIDGVPLGDSWPCKTMPPSPPGQPWENIVPFHKLTQWLTYSLMAPMSKLMKVRFLGEELLTGLPEYRNGGLLIDTGLLTLKSADHERGLAAYHDNAQKIGQPNVEVVPLFTADDDVIVEWRALTVGFLDELLSEVNGILGLSSANGLSLPQLLEAGTWKGGRELAEVSRPNTKDAPIMILSDGTVF